MQPNTMYKLRPVNISVGADGHALQEGINKEASTRKSTDPLVILPTPNENHKNQLNSILAHTLSNSATFKESSEAVRNLVEFLKGFISKGTSPAIQLGKRLCSNVIIMVIEKYVKVVLSQKKGSTKALSSAASIRNEVTKPLKEVIETLHYGMPTSGFLLLPLTWKECRPLHLVLNHILEILQSVTLGPKCGNDYARILTFLLQFECYQNALTPAFVNAFTGQLISLLETPMKKVKEEITEWASYAVALSTLLACPIAIKNVSTTSTGSSTSNGLEDTATFMRRLIKATYMHHTESSPQESTMTLQTHLVISIRILVQKTQYDAAGAVASQPFPLIRTLLGMWHLTKGRDGWRMEVAHFTSVQLALVFCVPLASLWRSQQQLNCSTDEFSDRPESKNHLSDYYIGADKAAMYQHSHLRILHEQVLPILLPWLDVHHCDFGTTSTRELQHIPCLQLKPIFDLASLVIYLVGLTQEEYYASKQSAKEMGRFRTEENVENGNEDSELIIASGSAEFNGEAPMRKERKGDLDAPVGSQLHQRINKIAIEDPSDRSDSTYLWLHIIASPITTLSLDNTQAQAICELLLKILNGCDPGMEPLLYAAASPLLPKCNKEFLSAYFTKILPRVVISNSGGIDYTSSIPAASLTSQHHIPPPSEHGYSFMLHLVHALRSKGVFHLIIPEGFSTQRCPHFQCGTFLGDEDPIEARQKNKANNNTIYVRQGYSSLVAQFLMEASVFSCSYLSVVSEALNNENVGVIGNPGSLLYNQQIMGEAPTTVANISNHATSPGANLCNLPLGAVSVKALISANGAANPDNALGQKRPRDDTLLNTTDGLQMEAGTDCVVDGKRTLNQFSASETPFVSNEIVMAYIVEGLGGVASYAVSSIAAQSAANYAATVVGNAGAVVCYLNAKSAVGGTYSPPPSIFNTLSTDSSLNSLKSEIHTRTACCEDIIVSSTFSSVASTLGMPIEAYHPLVISPFLLSHFDIPLLLQSLQSEYIHSMAFRSKIRAVGGGSTGQRLRHHYEERLQRASSSSLSISSHTISRQELIGQAVSVPLWNGRVPRAVSEAILVLNVFSSAVKEMSRDTSVDSDRLLKYIGIGGHSSLTTMSMMSVTDLSRLTTKFLKVFNLLAEASEVASTGITQASERLGTITPISGDINHSALFRSQSRITISAILTLRTLLNFSKDGVWSTTIDEDDARIISTSHFSSYTERWEVIKRLTPSGGLTLIALLLTRLIDSHLRNKPVGAILSNLLYLQESSIMMEVSSFADVLDGLLCSLQLLTAEVKRQWCSYDLLSWEPRGLFLSAIRSIVNWVADTLKSLLKVVAPDEVSVLISTPSMDSGQEGYRQQHQLGEGASLGLTSVVSNGSRRGSSGGTPVLFVLARCVGRCCYILTDLQLESSKQLEQNAGRDDEDPVADDDTRIKRIHQPTAFTKPLLDESSFTKWVEDLLSCCGLSGTNVEERKPMPNYLLLHCIEPLCMLLSCFQSSVDTSVDPHNLVLEVAMALCYRFIDTHITVVASILALFGRPSCKCDISTAQKAAKLVCDVAKGTVSIKPFDPNAAQEENRSSPYVITDAAKCNLAKAQAVLMLKCQGKSWGVDLGRLLFSSTGDSSSFIVRLQAAYYSAVPFKMFTKRQAVLRELITHVRGPLMEEWSKCVTALLALGQSCISAPSVEGDVVSFLLEICATKGFEHKNLIKEALAFTEQCQARHHHSGVHMNPSADGTSFMGHLHSTLISSAHRIKILQQQQMLSNAACLTRRHILRCTYDWVFRYNHPLDAFPSEALGIETSVEFISDYVSVLLPFAIMAKHKVRSAPKGSQELSGSGGALADLGGKFAQSRDKRDGMVELDEGNSASYLKIADVFRGRSDMDQLIRDQLPALMATFLTLSQLPDDAQTSKPNSPTPLRDVKITAQRSLEWVKLQIGRELFLVLVSQEVESIVAGILLKCRGSNSIRTDVSSPEQLCFHANSNLPYVTIGVAMKAITSLCSMIGTPNFSTLFGATRGYRAYQILLMVYHALIFAPSEPVRVEVFTTLQALLTGCYGAAILPIPLILEVTLNLICYIIRKFPYLRGAACETLQSVWTTVMETPSQKTNPKGDGPSELSPPISGPQALQPYFQMVSSSLAADSMESSDVARCFNFIVGQKAVSPQKAKIADGNCASLQGVPVRDSMPFTEPSQMLLALSQQEIPEDDDNTDFLIDGLNRERGVVTYNDNKEKERSAFDGPHTDERNLVALTETSVKDQALHIIRNLPSILSTFVASGGSACGSPTGPPASFFISLSRTFEDNAPFLIRSIIEDRQTEEWCRKTVGMNGDGTHKMLVENNTKRFHKIDLFSSGGVTKYKAPAPCTRSFLDEIQTAVKLLLDVTVHLDFPLETRTAALEALRALGMCCLEAGAFDILANGGPRHAECASTAESQSQRQHSLLDENLIINQAHPIHLDSIVSRSYARLILQMRALATDGSDPVMMRRASAALKLVLQAADGGGYHRHGGLGTGGIPKGAAVITESLKYLKEHDLRGYQKMSPFIGEKSIALQRISVGTHGTTIATMYHSLLLQHGFVTSISSDVPNIFEGRGNITASGKLELLNTGRGWDTSRKEMEGDDIINAIPALNSDTFWLFVKVDPNKFLCNLATRLSIDYIIRGFPFIAHLLPLLATHIGFAEQYLPLVFLHISLLPDGEASRSLNDFLGKRLHTVVLQKAHRHPRLTKAVLNALNYLRTVRGGVICAYGHREGNISLRKDLEAANLKSFMPPQVQPLSSGTHQGYRQTLWFSEIHFEILARAAAAVNEWSLCAMFVEISYENLAGLGGISALHIRYNTSESAEEGRQAHSLLPLAQQPKGRVLKDKAKQIEIAEKIYDHHTNLLPVIKEYGDLLDDRCMINAMLFHQSTEKGRMTGPSTSAKICRRPWGITWDDVHERANLMGMWGVSLQASDALLTIGKGATHIGPAQSLSQQLMNMGCYQTVSAISKCKDLRELQAEASWRLAKWDEDIPRTSHAPMNQLIMNERGAQTPSSVHFSIFEALSNFTHSDHMAVRNSVLEGQQSIAVNINAFNVVPSIVKTQILRDIFLCSRLKQTYVEKQVAPRILGINGDDDDPNEGLCSLSMMPPHFLNIETKESSISGKLQERKRLDVFKKAMGVVTNYELIEPLAAARDALCSIIGNPEWHANFLVEAAEDATSTGRPFNAHRWIMNFTDRLVRQCNLYHSNYKTGDKLSSNAVIISDILNRPEMILALAKLQHSVGDTSGAVNMLSSGLANRVVQCTEAIDLIAQWSNQLQLVPASAIVRDDTFRAALYNDSKLAKTYGTLCDNLATDIERRLISPEFAEFQKVINDTLQSAKSDLTLLGKTDKEKDKEKQNQVKNQLRYREKEAQRETNYIQELTNSYNIYKATAIVAYVASLTQSGVASSTSDLHTVHRILSLGFGDSTVAAASSSKEDVEPTLKIPPHKLLPIFPQLAVRLGSNSSNSEILEKLVLSIVMHFPNQTLWTIFALKNGDRFSDGLPHHVDHTKIEAVKKILKECKSVNVDYSNLINQMQIASEAYLDLAWQKIQRNEKSSVKELSSDAKIIQAGALCPMVPIPTLPVRASLRSLVGGIGNTEYRNGDHEISESGLRQRDIDCIVSFRSTYTILCGLSMPKLITCVSSTGLVCRQLVKAKDDMRQDAIMLQFFGLSNTLLSSSIGVQNSNRKGDVAAGQPIGAIGGLGERLIDNGSSSTAFNDSGPMVSRRNARFLNIRTYIAAPLSPDSGIIQFVENTTMLGDYLVGPNNNDLGAHHRYFPMDKPYMECRAEMGALKNRAKGPTSETIATFADICAKFTPCLHYFFYEHFGTANEWLQARSRYTLTTAAISIVGFYLGLGDRHNSNILIDYRTGDVVHIDLGIAFDQGRNLPLPETVPFRLTRDIVDGMGIQGTEGSFKAGCEETMSIIRKHKGLLHTVLEAFVYDPLAKWAIDVEEHYKRQQAKQQQSAQSPDSEIATEREGSKRKSYTEKAKPPKPLDAHRALQKVSDKLNGVETSTVQNLGVTSHVQKLIQKAADPEALSCLFEGWAPWV